MIMLREVRLLDPPSRTDAVRDILIAERKIIKIGEKLELDARLIAEAKGEGLQIIDCRSGRHLQRGCGDRDPGGSGRRLHFRGLHGEHQTSDRQ